MDIQLAKRRSYVVCYVVLLGESMTCTRIFPYNRFKSSQARNGILHCLTRCKGSRKFIFMFWKIFLHNAVATSTRWQLVSFSWRWKEEGYWPKSQRSTVYNLDWAQERDRRRHVGWYAAAQAALNQPPGKNLDRLHVPLTLLYSDMADCQRCLQNYPSGLQWTLPFYIYHFLLQWDLMRSAGFSPGCRYIRKMYSRLAIRIILPWKAWLAFHYPELSRSYQLCSQVKCNQ